MGDVICLYFTQEDPASYPPRSRVCSGAVSVSERVSFKTHFPPSPPPPRVLSLLVLVVFLVLVIVELALVQDRLPPLAEATIEIFTLLFTAFFCGEVALRIVGQG